MESTIMQPSLVGEYQRTSIGCAVILYFHLHLTGIFRRSWGFKSKLDPGFFHGFILTALAGGYQRVDHTVFPTPVLLLLLYCETTNVVLTMFGYLVAVQSCVGCSWCIVLQCIVLSHDSCSCEYVSQ